MGRPKLSAAHHALVGTKAHASTAKTESNLPASCPQMPSHLSKEARKEWKKILPKLLERGSLTDADSTALSLYVETYSRWLTAKRDVETNGIAVSVTVLDKHGTPVTTRKSNPALRTLENCERSLRSFLREFGMTPATRERVLPTQQREQKEETLLDILNRERDDDEE